MHLHALLLFPIPPLLNYDILPMTSELFSSIIFMAASFPMFYNSTGNDITLHSVIKEGLRLQAESLQILSSQCLSLSEDALFALLEYGAPDNKAELMIGAFVAASPHHSSFLHSLLLNLKATDKDKCRECFNTYDSAIFATILCAVAPTTTAI